MPKRYTPLRLSKRHAALLKAEEPVETDLHYWLMHALHWQAFLVVVTTGLYLGYTFSPSKASASPPIYPNETDQMLAVATPPKPTVAMNALPSATTVNVFTKDLKTGVTDDQVLQLQKFLNTHGFVIAKTGPGSPGNETDLFGGGTRTELAAWQAKNGLSSESGVVGAKTRAALNKLVAPAPAPASTSPAASPAPTANVFTKDLKTGTQDDQVLLLQRFLNTHGYVITKSGPGSPGNETNLFGAGTRTALSAWQAKNGLRSEKGVVGAKTRAALNKLVAPVPAKPPAPTVVSLTPLFPPAPTGAVSSTPEIPAPQPWNLGALVLSGPTKVKVGTSFTVTAVLNNAINVDTFRLNGHFDPKLLKLTKVSPLAFEMESPANAINNASGTFSYGRFTVGKRATGAIKMAVFTFTPLKNGTSTISLDPTSHALVDGQEDSGSFKGLDLSISGGKK